MMKRNVLPALALLTFLPASAGLSAQESTTRGLTLGVHLSGSSLTVESGDPSNGGGAGIRVGYGINRIVTLFAQVDGSQVDVDDTDDLAGAWTMAHVDLGARFNFASTLRSWVPYLEAALTTRAVSVDNATVGQQAAGSISFSGAALTAGGGISLYLKQTLALDVGVKLTAGEFTQIDVGAISVGGLDIDAQSARFNVGLAWWP
jgi:hypothetical protein